MRIEFSPWCVGNRLEKDLIVIHPNLAKMPRLYKAVLDHEMSHNTNNHKEDFLIDLKHLLHSIGMVPYYFLFVLKNPRSLAQGLPFFVHRDKLYWDIPLLVFWVALWLAYLFIIWWF